MGEFSAGVAELADARDLGSRVFTTCRFDSCRPHWSDPAQDLRIGTQKTRFWRVRSELPGRHGAGGGYLQIEAAMNVSGPSIPFHLARAYGVPPNAAVRPVNPVVRQTGPAAQPASRPTDSVGLTSAVQGIRPTEAGRAQRIDALVGAEVPGGVRFTENGPEPTTNPSDLRSAVAIRALVEGKSAASAPNLESAAIPMYRNPAMKIAAAASIAHSRNSLDVSG